MRRIQCVGWDDAKAFFRQKATFMRSNGSPNMLYMTIFLILPTLNVLETPTLIPPLPSNVAGNLAFFGEKAPLFYAK